VSYNPAMQGTVVGVLRGGPSREHEVSLRTGAAILQNLEEPRYIARDIYIDKSGQWYDRGKMTAPERVLPTLDVVIIGLHGEYGEDGGVQRLLEQYGVPYTGADSFASFLTMHKLMSKEKMREAGLLVPTYRFVEEASKAPEIVADVVRTFHQPVVVKPVAWGSSVGVSIVAGYAPALTAVENLFIAGATGVLIEEFIRGTEATVGVVENLRGEDLYALPPVEIIPPGEDFYSYESKYSGETRHICPARIPKKVSDQLLAAARNAHQTLGLRHYSRSDFIISPKGVYYLETNSLPGVTEESNLPIALDAIGMKFPDFLTHLVNLALSR
jgi:D-alanine-D-alanine ligase